MQCIAPLLCCCRIDAARELSPADFDIDSGVCRPLTAEGLCAIYEHRLEICNVELC